MLMRRPLRGQATALHIEHQVKQRGHVRRRQRRVHKQLHTEQILLAMAHIKHNAANRFFRSGRMAYQVII